MLAYIIDGFNLVHKISSLKNSASPHTCLIQYIKRNKLTGSRRNRVVMVFDGGINEEAAGEREYEVIFSQDRSADDLIKERVKHAKNKSQILVVSDDREIRDAIKSEGACPLRTADFLKIKKKDNQEKEKEISYTLQREITEDMRKVWLGE
ncbi:MAG: NYN domain-containing protein [Candidatus Omnitrophica bacterium]|nr:NYN domain-containing protein [Candidatus Omnitrophota bacterium]